MSSVGIWSSTVVSGKGEEINGGATAELNTRSSRNSFNEK